jgi:hypothetical protein
VREHETRQAARPVIARVQFADGVCGVWFIPADEPDLPIIVQAENRS